MWNAWERRVKCIKFLVGNSQGKRPLGKPRCRWLDGLSIDLRENGWGV
jgi:hypothetical protein